MVPSQKSNGSAGLHDAVGAAQKCGAVAEVFLNKENTLLNVCDEIRTHVRRRPDAPALVSAEATLTFSELYASAGRLADLLRSRGIGAEDIVGVSTGRTPGLAVGLLAVMRAGAALCVLDRSDPPARVRRLRDVGVRHLITGAGQLAEPAPAAGTAAGGVHTGPRPQRTRRGHIAHGESLAYVVFTSGSTGDPKAIGMPHRGLGHLIAWTLEATSASPLRTLQFAALGFDVFIQEVFTTWCSGGTLYLPADEERNDLSRIVELIGVWGIERLFLPPLALYRLAELPIQQDRVLTTLREVCVAGEPLRVTSGVRRLFSGLTRCRLHNHYGPAETHVATSYTFQGDPASWPDPPPIGVPVGGMRARILGPGGHDLPAGAEGELSLAGPGVARGYLNDPVLTAQRFLPGRDGTRCYRTGDLAVLGGDGLIRFVGRGDDQLKIDGYRVEPAEVETVLARHPLVKECAVAAWQPPGGDRRLVAYVVPRPGAAAANLRHYLAGLLPGFMVPAHVMVMTTLPVTKNGKVDRRGLPPPDQAQLLADQAYDPPAGRLEQEIAALWAGLLKVPRVGRHTNFGELGGNSLAAGLMLSRFHKSHGIKVSLREFSADPTVHGLAALGASRKRR